MTMKKPDRADADAAEIRRRAARTDEVAYWKVLDKVSDLPPMDGDKLD